MHVIIRTDSVNSVLSERGQSQKPLLHLISFLWTIQKKKICRGRKQISGCWGLGGKGEGWVAREVTANAHAVCSAEMKMSAWLLYPLWLLSRCWQRKLWQFLLAFQCFCRGTITQSCLLCHLTKVTPRFTFKVLRWLLLRFYGGRNYQNSLNCFKQKTEFRITSAILYGDAYTLGLSTIQEYHDYAYLKLVNDTALQMIKN